MRQAKMTVLLTAAAVGSMVMSAVPAGALAVPARAARSWHVSLLVAGSKFPGFTAVTATGRNSAWAFDESDGSSPGAYQLSGSSWHKRTFPGVSDDEVVSAGSSSASNVWAFTETGRAMRFNGSSWSLVKTFRGEISSGLVISKTDVWVFSSLGTWHYNGAAWTRSVGGKGLLGASALSPSSIWAYGVTSVAHWNGRTWTRTSLRRLVPKIELGSPFLAGIYAASARSIYVNGSEGAESVGGPLVLLHGNGTSWRRLAISKRIGGPTAIIPDGMGGVWVPVLVFILGGGVDHYSRGALSNTRLPIPGTRLRLVSAAAVPHSTVAFVVGETGSSTSSKNDSAVILRYGL
jgi:hypothetical protein